MGARFLVRGLFPLVALVGGASLVSGSGDCVAPKRAGGPAGLLASVQSFDDCGILKEQLGARRFLLRGLANVRAEFRLLATAFNLRTLWPVWRTRWRRRETEAAST